MIKKSLIVIAILLAIFYRVGVVNQRSESIKLGLSTFQVVQGGTGATSFTTGECLKGNGTGALTTGTCGTSDGYGFITDSYAGLTVQSTTTALWLKDLTPYSLLASSTLFTYASTTYGSFETSSSTEAYFGTGQGALYIGSGARMNAVATSSLNTNGTSITNTGTMGALVGGTNATISLNLGNPNTWTVNQTFNYSSSTAYSSFLTASSTFSNIGTLTFGGVTGSAWSSFCTSITGGAGLCDGSDDGGSGFTGAANSIIVSDSAGTALAATSSHPLYIGAFNATSTTVRSGIASSTPFSTLSINALGGESSFSIGSSTGTYFKVGSTGFVGVGQSNPSKLLHVGSGTTVQSSTNNAILLNGLSAAYILRDSGVSNSESTWKWNSSDAQIGLVNGLAGQTFSLVAANTVPRLTIDGLHDLVGIGTTTFTAASGRLTIASTTGSQLSLMGNNTDNKWNLRSIGNSFYLSTSSPSSAFSTTSIDALYINSDNIVRFGNNNATCIALTGSSALCDGSDDGGVGTSAYEIATTSDIGTPNLAYFTKTSGRTTLGSVATTTLTASVPLSLSQAVVKVGGSNSVLSLDTSGAWTGSAGSVANALTNDATLNGSSFNGSAAISDWGLNLANPNTWTVNQTFNYSSSTAYSSFVTSSTTDAYFGTGQGVAYIGSGGRLRTTATSTFSLSQFTNDLASLTATNPSLTFSGSYNGATARTVGLNVGNANTWTALQTFNYSSTTAYSSFVTASTTNLFAGLMTFSTTTAGCLKTNTSGLVFAETCSAGGGITSLTMGQGMHGSANPITTTGTIYGNHYANYVVSTSTNTGDFTSLQSAIDALPSTGGKIHVTCGVFTLSATTTIKVANTVIEGEGICTQFNFDAPTVFSAFVMNATGLSGIQIKDLYINQTNATLAGIGINASNTPLLIVQRVKIQGTATSTSLKDTANQTFYQSWENLDFRNNKTCIDIGDNPVNDNSFKDIRCAPTAGLGGFGLYIDSSSANGAQSNSFYNFNSEPTGSGAGITGIYCNNCVNSQFYGAYVEGNGTGWNLTANAQRNTFHGGEFVTNTTYANNGKNNQWLGVDKESTAFNLIMASSTIMDAGSTDASKPSLTITGNTSFAKVAPFLYIANNNTTDTGTTTQIVNVSTSGISFEVDDQVNDTSPFVIDANGSLGIGTAAPTSILHVVGNWLTSLFTVATSTSMNPIVSVSATTTSGMYKEWARFAIGTSSIVTGIGERNNLTVQGNIYSTKAYVSCETMMQFGNPTADVSRACSSLFDFDEDAQGAGNTSVESDGTQYFGIWAGVTAATTALVASGNGAAITPTNGGSAGAFTSASSSPIFEARVAASPVNATSTTFLVGFYQGSTGSNWDGLNSTLGPGYYFIASTTKNNWQIAAAETGGGSNAISADSGVASTTGVSNYQTLRIEIYNSDAGLTTANYYIDNRFVGQLTRSGVSAKASLNPVVAIGAQNQAGFAKQIKVTYIRAWSDLIPNRKN